MFGLHGRRMLLWTERQEEPDDHAPNASFLLSGSALGPGGHHPGGLAQVKKKEDYLDLFFFYCTEYCNFQQLFKKNFNCPLVGV